uniref:Fucosyltransferase n=1 Tax=Timema douglasi TaxID=61478 RepID=A0A7R8VE04_TIMDO|nr:unnamed protein product [Timema douglasi]
MATFPGVSKAANFKANSSLTFHWLTGTRARICEYQHHFSPISLHSRHSVLQTSSSALLRSVPILSLPLQTCAPALPLYPPLVHTFPSLNFTTLTLYPPLVHTSASLNFTALPLYPPLVHTSPSLNFTDSLYSILTHLLFHTLLQYLSILEVQMMEGYWIVVSNLKYNKDIDRQERGDNIMGQKSSLKPLWRHTTYFSSHPSVYEKYTKIFVWNCAPHSSSDVVFDYCVHAHIGWGGEKGGTASYMSFAVTIEISLHIIKQANTRTHSFPFERQMRGHTAQQETIHTSLKYQQKPSVERMEWGLPLLSVHRADNPLRLHSIRPLDLKNEIVLHYSPSIQKGLDNLYIKLVDLQSRADTVLSKKMKKMSLRQSFILFLCHKTICIGFVLFCFCSYWLMYSTDLTWLWQLNLQVMRGPNPDFKKDNLKTILLWNDFFNSKHFGFGVGREPFINAGCPVTNCTIVDRSDGYLPLPIEDFNAIWFHMVDSSGVHFPLKRNKHQRYIYFALESPVTMKTLYKTIPIPPDFFNWSMTYRRDSDIHFPYGWVSPISKKSPMPAMPDTKIPIWMEPDFSQLKYVTEKFFRALHSNVVPIVYGGADYKTLAPPLSYIDVSDFSSLMELSEYLKHLDNTPEEYINELYTRPSRSTARPRALANSRTQIQLPLLPLAVTPKTLFYHLGLDVGLVREADKGLGLEEPTVVFDKRVDGLLEASLHLIGTEVVTGDVLPTREATKDTVCFFTTGFVKGFVGEAVGSRHLHMSCGWEGSNTSGISPSSPSLGELTSNLSIDTFTDNGLSVVVDTNLLEATGAGALVTIGLTASPFISEVDVGLVREADKGLGLEEPTVVFDKRVDGLLEASLHLIGTEVVTGDVLPTREATKDTVCFFTTGFVKGFVGEAGVDLTGARVVVIVVFLLDFKGADLALSPNPDFLSLPKAGFLDTFFFSSEVGLSRARAVPAIEVVTIPATAVLIAKVSSVAGTLSTALSVYLEQ